MAGWPNPLLSPRTVQRPYLQKRWRWGLSSNVFLQLLGDRRAHTAVLQDQETNDSSSHSLCACAKDRTLRWLPPSIWRCGFPRQPVHVCCSTGRLHRLTRFHLFSHRMPPMFSSKIYSRSWHWKSLSLGVVLSTPAASWLKAVRAQTEIYWHQIVVFLRLL